MDYFEYWSQMKTAIDAVPHDKVIEFQSLILDLPSSQGQVLTIGNGGSASTAEHASCDLSKGLKNATPKARYRSTCLTSNSSLLTAWSNDSSYEEALANLVVTFGTSNDILLAISGSGNSTNILRSVYAAKAMGIFTVALTGFDGGQLAKMVDLDIRAHSYDMQVVENLHLAIIHSLVKECIDK